MLPRTFQIPNPFTVALVVLMTVTLGAVLLPLVAVAAVVGAVRRLLGDDRRSEPESVQAEADLVAAVRQVYGDPNPRGLDRDRGKLG